MMGEVYDDQTDNQGTISEYGAALSADEERARQVAWWDALYRGLNPVTGELANSEIRASMARAARNADLSDDPTYCPAIANFRESQGPIAWFDWLLSHLCRN